MKKFKIKKVIISFLLILMIIQVAAINVDAYAKNNFKSKCKIENPYDNINWETINGIKANLHAHTTKSDGRNTIQDVINKYSEEGYSVLAITDHDHLTYPWNDEIKGEKDIIIPRSLNSIAGNEYSFGIHHINGFFINNIYEFKNEEEVLKQIEKQGGISHLNHPGRYKKEIEWYLKLLNNYDSLLGLEVINRNDRYPSDRKLWDSVLTKIIDKRNVWGFANDDSHRREHIDTSYNVALIEGNYSDNKFKKALKNGQFYFVSKICEENNRQSKESVKPPSISNINVDNKELSIAIQGKNIDNIQWIGENGVELATGNKFIVTECKRTSYVRAVIKGDGGVAFTQPFRIIF
ncbi:PHP domain-containing protein [Clostridium sporogenes]|uniref:PHP domain-containing protein n=1 Tax=Clostridium sporogenes TaxID=1509 RepID=UPI003DA31D15